MASLGLPGAVCARFVRLDCRILGHAAPDEKLLPRDLRSLPQHDLLPQMETAASLSPQQRLHLRLAPPEGTHRCALVQPPQQSLFSPSQLPRHGHPRWLEQYLGGRLGRPTPRPHPAFCRYALSLPSFLHPYPNSDHWRNSRVVAEKEVGLVLDKKTVTADRLSSALDEVIFDPRYSPFESGEPIPLGTLYKRGRSPPCSGIPRRPLSHDS